MFVAPAAEKGRLLLLKGCKFVRAFLTLQRRTDHSCARTATHQSDLGGRMIKPAAIILAVAMGAISAGTYYGLDLLPAGAIPEPFGRAQKPEPPKPGTAIKAPAPATTTAAAPAPQPAPSEPPVTEQDLAEDPPPPAPDPVAQAEAEPAPTPEPEPAPAASAPKPEAAPAPRDAPPPKPAARPRTEVASAAPAQPVKPRPPEADVIKPWWPDSSKLPASQLKLQYAGQVQGEQAIALLFSAPLKLDSLRQHVQVKNATGGAVNGAWELGKNPRLAVFRGVGSGRYTVILSPQVADTKGFMLGQTLTGPVYIQPPQ
jgi:hypothetical protein